MKAMNGNIEDKTIKRLVRHRLTRRYLTEHGWTDSPDNAKVFSDALDAAQACARRGLLDVELALLVGPGTCDLFSTPLR